MAKQRREEEEDICVDSQDINIITKDLNHNK